MKSKFVFDLDNTLVYTDSLNNEAYNYALLHMGLQKIESTARITRTTLLYKFPNLTPVEKSKIIQMKQKYFVDNIYKTELNFKLRDFLRSCGPENCMLWTRAERGRVRELLCYYEMQNAFKFILHSNKESIQQDIRDICEIFSCTKERLVFYEDNPIIVAKLNSMQVNVGKDID